LEILALILLGLIAMLAIVPPIIRGKLDESPLATTQNFHRSMEELGHSLEPDEYCARGERRLEGSPSEDAGRPRQDRRIMPPGHSYGHASRASVRRNRILAGLMIFASIWGVATLVSGSAWCLVLFAIACFVLVSYWALTIVVPRLALQSRPSELPQRSEGHLEEVGSPPRSQAL
jgi:hypothetical protein